MTLTTYQFYILSALAGWAALRMVFRLARCLIRVKENISMIIRYANWTREHWETITKLSQIFNYWDFESDWKRAKEKIEKLERRFEVAQIAKLSSNSESYKYRDQPWYAEAKKQWGVVDSGYEKDLGGIGV